MTTTANSTTRQREWLGLGLAILVGLGAGLASSWWLRAKDGAGISLSAEKLAFSEGKYAGANAAERAIIGTYRHGHPKTVESRLGMLNAMGNWAVKEPLDFANAVTPLLFNSTTDGLLGDPAAALAAAAKIENPAVRSQVISEAFKALTKADPMKALELVPVLHGSLPMAVEELAAELGKSADARRIGLILKSPNCTGPFFTLVMAAWVKVDTEEALHFLDGLNSANGLDERINVLDIWRELGDKGNGETRLRYLEKLAPSRERDEFIASAKASILADAPEKWLALLGAESDRLVLGKVAHDAAFKAVNNSPEKAMTLLSWIPGEAEKRKATSDATVRLLVKTQKDPAAMERWLRSAQDPVISEAIVKELRFQKVPLPKGF